MNHAQMIDTYSNRALHYATRARVYREAAERCRTGGLKASAHHHSTGARASRAHVIDAAQVVVAELTLQAALARLAEATGTRAVMADPFDSSRVVVAQYDSLGRPIAYFLPASKA
jgi:hypothetical protein